MKPLNFAKGVQMNALQMQKNVGKKDWMSAPDFAWNAQQRAIML